MKQYLRKLLSTKATTTVDVTGKREPSDIQSDASVVRPWACDIQGDASVVRPWACDIQSDASVVRPWACDIQGDASVVRPSTETAARADTYRDSCRAQQHDRRSVLYFQVLYWHPHDADPSAQVMYNWMKWKDKEWQVHVI